MNITNITGYTSARQAQNINFGAVKVSPLVKDKCDLSDKDHKKLNKRCPYCLDINVDDHDSYCTNCRVVRFNVSLDGKKPTIDGEFNILLDSLAKVENKREFMKEINTVIRMYN